MIFYFDLVSVKEGVLTGFRGGAFTGSRWSLITFFFGSSSKNAEKFMLFLRDYRSC